MQRKFNFAGERERDDILSILPAAFRLIDHFSTQTGFLKPPFIKCLQHLPLVFITPAPPPLHSKCWPRVAHIFLSLLSAIVWLTNMCPIYETVAKSLVFLPNFFSIHVR